MFVVLLCNVQSVNYMRMILAETEIEENTERYREREGRKNENNRVEKKNKKSLLSSGDGYRLLNG